jgi:hypothetical protein
MQCLGYDTISDIHTRLKNIVRPNVRNGHTEEHLSKINL